MIFLQSQPHSALQKYIGQYIFTSFNTNILPSLKQTFLPYDLPAITFFIGSVSFEDTKEYLPRALPATNHSTFAYYNALSDGSTSMHFKKNSVIKAFVIPFKASGFSALFKGNMAELTNLLPDFLLLVGATDGNRFLEQLVEATSFAEQVSVLDNFFLKKIPRRQNDGLQIIEACRRLIVSDGLMNMKELAYHTNMSLRNLERQFTEKVGVSPKMFARFKRFHHALSLMNHQKPPSWSSIAYQCGYYDQAHFIKEFKTFSNHSPSSYSPNEYLLYNQIILFRNFSSF